MSWDISITRFKEIYSSIEEIPDDAVVEVLGKATDVRKAISDIFPRTNWNDSSWGTFDCDIGSIEFNVGNEDPCVGMMLHVRAGNEIVFPIIELCKKNDWQALDCASGEFLEKSENPEYGLEKWREYRNRVLGGHA